MVIALCGEGCGLNGLDSPFRSIYGIIFTSWLLLKSAVGWLLARVKERKLGP